RPSPPRLRMRKKFCLIRLKTRFTGTLRSTSCLTKSGTCKEHPMTQQHALQEYLLRLADSDMILGQRLSELVGKCPALEEELASTNVALDLIGQARNWYEYAAELINDGRDADQLVFLRDAHDYRNLLMVEQPNEDYA